MVYASACVYRGKFGKHDSKTTGNPGSVIVPQYGSSLIIVFVWGKNTILKFVGNMKLTLQLVVRLCLKLKRIFVIICSNSAVKFRIALDIEINEAQEQTNPAGFDKLEGYNPKIKAESAEVARQLDRIG